jgi:hypothetical protein
MFGPEYLLIHLIPYCFILSQTQCITVSGNWIRVEVMTYGEIAEKVEDDVHVRAPIQDHGSADGADLIT